MLLFNGLVKIFHYCIKIKKKYQWVLYFIYFETFYYECKHHILYFIIILIEKSLKVSNYLKLFPINVFLINKYHLLYKLNLSGLYFSLLFLKPYLISNNCNLFQIVFIEKQKYLNFFIFGCCLIESQTELKVLINFYFW